MNLNEPVDHDLHGKPLYNPLRDFINNAPIPVFYKEVTEDADIGNQEGCA